VNLETINSQASKGTQFSPFANFFKSREGEESSPAEETKSE
jgi:hypothetical protein